MPEYVDVPLDYEPWSGIQPVFRRGPAQFRECEFRQSQPAEQSNRQTHFEQQLLRVSEALGLVNVPFYVRWRGGQKMQLDRGCVGHSMRRGFVSGLRVGPTGHVTHVIVANQRTTS